MRKKKLKYEDFLEILKTNTKESPLNINNYDKQSILDCKLKYKDNKLYISFNCEDCGKSVTKTMNRSKCFLKFMQYCKVCLSKRTCLVKFGVENAMHSDDLKSKLIKTNLEKYNCENVFQNEEIKNKIVKTNRKRFGVSYPMQSKKIQEKSKEVINNKYGVDNVFQNVDIIKKSQETKLDKYGSLNTNHVYLYDNIEFDSSWELAFYIYHKDKGHKIEHESKCFSYDYNNKIHKYYPDFKVANKYYEIKGDQFLTFYKNGKIKGMRCPFDHIKDELFNAKYKCMKKHKVNIISNKKIKRYLNYIDKTYGKNYLEKFKNEKKEIY